jgi:hypothetical protein
MDGGDKSAHAGKSKAEMLAAFGQPVIVRFFSGYDVWVFRGNEQRNPREKPIEPSELVLLFDPSGAVAKSRLRPAVPAKS